MVVKVVISIIMWIMLIVSVGCHAEVEENLNHEHLWETYREEIHGSILPSIELYEQTNTCHAYMQMFPVKACTACGEIQYGGSAPYVMHSYVVQEYSLQQNGEMIQITLKCQVCQYMYTEQCEVQLIIEGKMQSCLLGGNCTSNAQGYLYESCIILPETKGNLPADFLEGERVLHFALVYEENERAFFTAVRQHCSLCGRPWIAMLTEPTTKFKEEWNGFPIMTEEYFLTVDMPDNLPYQLIDQLRKGAGAA